ncbi:MAG: hypothetical protein HXS46_03015 [Theionarchaea archaeon]|nr:MAG: hypothetical protein AYK18_00025 [Theionarchaea archaeon DG-70]MBU7009636.1 hypothetical protein [Theionarchaea archaeon]
MKVKIKISVVVHHTESKRNIEKALKNLFPSIEFTLSGGYFIGTSTDIHSLDHFKELLKIQRIRDTAHTLLERSLSGNNLVFSLNKQAAFMGKVNFSEECPLGPVTVSIKGEDLNSLISHLSPRTAEQ